MEKQSNVFFIIGLVFITLFLIVGFEYYFNKENRIYDDVKESYMLKEVFTPQRDENFYLEKIERNNSKVLNLYFVAKKTYINLVEGNPTLLWTYNDTFPGPIIRARKGDVINVTIKNELDVNTTIHWHGMRVPNQMDGVPDITQKPIPPNGTFNYQFKVLDGGIYIYHPHYNTPEQIERGLYGGIVVDYDNDPYEYDRDILMILDDILLENNNQVADFYKTMHTTMMGRYGNVLLVNGKVNPTYYAKEGEVVRLRFINIANARTFYISLINRETNKKIPFLVIGEDISFSNKPYETTLLEVAPGQRYDVLVYLPDEGNYSFIYYSNQGYISISNLIANKSSSVDKVDSYSKNKNQYVYENEQDFQDLIANVDNAEIINIDLYAEMQGMMEMKWSINGRVYPDDTLFIPVDEGRYYILEMRNLNSVPHPMHLHGQRMLVLDGDGIYSFKDTVVIPPNGKLRTIFKAEGKGLWLFHCHILEHAQEGMISVIKVS